MSSSAPSFQSLLEQSRQLTNHIITPGLPQLERGLDQIENQSRKLVTKAAREGGNIVDTRTAYLLANKGYDAERVSETLNAINLASTFEPLQPLHDTDIEGYLRHEHEMVILSTIEESRQQTVRDFEEGFERSLHRDWERVKKRIFEELGQHQGPGYSKYSRLEGVFQDILQKGIFPGGASTPGRGGTTPSFISTSGPGFAGSIGVGTTLQMVPRMKNYSKVVQELNDARLRGEKFGVITSFMEVSKQLDKGDASEQQITDCWKLLATILGEKDVVRGRFEREALGPLHYAKLYKAQEIEGGFADDALKFRQLVINGGKEFLQKQFWSYVELTVYQNHAVIGGTPTVDTMIQAFINIRFKKYGQWIKPYLEVVNGQSIWTHLFYLLRSGHRREAVEFVRRNDQDFLRSDANFTAYFKAWASSENGRLPRNLRESLLIHWNNHIRPLINVDQRGQWVGGDPFKVAVYKIIGRCELNRKTIPGSDVLPSTEDYLWFQLVLILEDIRPEDPIHEKFTLRDMAKMMMRFGASHFSPRGKQPIMWFMVQLLCGEFERAVQYLFTCEQLVVDAVHFATALAYYGVLRVPESPHVADAGLQLLNFRSVATPSGAYEVAYFNFARMIHQYIRHFQRSDPVDALHYIYLIGLFGRELEDDVDFGSSAAGASAGLALGGTRVPAGSSAAEIAHAREYTRLAHHFVRECILENTDQLSALLGEVRLDGTKTPGQVEKYGSLLHLRSREEFTARITRLAAQMCDRDGKYTDAVKLYDLACDYDTVLAILNKQLGESLSAGFSSSTLMGSPSKFGSSAASYSGLSGGAADTVNLAEQILQLYLSRPHTARQISQERRHACGLLIALHKFMRYYESGDLQAALETIDALDLLPTKNDVATIQRKAFELEQLDENVARAIPQILVATMTILSKMWATLREGRFGPMGGVFGSGLGGGESTQQARMMDIRNRSKALVLFTANVRYKIPGDTYAQLNRLEANMK
ncbi:hypothetical protein HK102_006381 [Quaeritorhiza haematococci]|nr:hypothetical protein HK102_006381 [Quaeritorhiza haematococci]